LQIQQEMNSQGRLWAPPSLMSRDHCSNTAGNEGNNVLNTKLPNANLLQFASHGVKVERFATINPNNNNSNYNNKVGATTIQQHSQLQSQQQHSYVQQQQQQHQRGMSTLSTQEQEERNRVDQQAEALKQQWLSQDQFLGEADRIVHWIELVLEQLMVVPTNTVADSLATEINKNTVSNFGGTFSDGGITANGNNNTSLPLSDSKRKFYSQVYIESLKRYLSYLDRFVDTTSSQPSNSNAGGEQQPRTPVVFQTNLLILVDPKRLYNVWTLALSLFTTNTLPPTRTQSGNTDELGIASPPQIGYLLEFICTQLPRKVLEQPNQRSKWVEPVVRAIPGLFQVFELSKTTTTTTKKQASLHNIGNNNSNNNNSIDSQDSQFVDRFTTLFYCYNVLTGDREQPRGTDTVTTGEDEREALDIAVSLYDTLVYTNVDLSHQFAWRQFGQNQLVQEGHSGFAYLSLDVYLELSHQLVVCFTRQTLLQSSSSYQSINVSLLKSWYLLRTQLSYYDCLRQRTETNAAASQACKKVLSYICHLLHFICILTASRSNASGTLDCTPKRSTEQSNHRNNNINNSNNNSNSSSKKSSYSTGVYVQRQQYELTEERKLRSAKNSCIDGLLAVLLRLMQQGPSTSTSYHNASAEATTHSILLSHYNEWKMFTEKLCSMLTILNLAIADANTLLSSPLEQQSTTNSAAPAEIHNLFRPENREVVFQILTAGYNQCYAGFQTRMQTWLLQRSQSSSSLATSNRTTTTHKGSGANTKRKLQSVDEVVVSTKQEGEKEEEDAGNAPPKSQEKESQSNSTLHLELSWKLLEQQLVQLFLHFYRPRLHEHLEKYDWSGLIHNAEFRQFFFRYFRYLAGDPVQQKAVFETLVQNHPKHQFLNHLLPYIVDIPTLCPVAKQWESSTSSSTIITAAASSLEQDPTVTNIANTTTAGTEVTYEKERTLLWSAISQFFKAMDPHNAPSALMSDATHRRSTTTTSSTGNNNAANAVTATQDSTMNGVEQRPAYCFLPGLSFATVQSIWVTKQLPSLSPSVSGANNHNNNSGNNSVKHSVDRLTEVECFAAYVQVQEIVVANRLALQSPWSEFFPKLLEYSVLETSRQLILTMFQQSMTTTTTPPRSNKNNNNIGNNGNNGNNAMMDDTSCIVVKQEPSAPTAETAARLSYAKRIFRAWLCQRHQQYTSSCNNHDELLQRLYVDYVRDPFAYFTALSFAYKLAYWNACFQSVRVKIEQ
jgi:hypothetical protein